MDVDALRTRLGLTRDADLADRLGVPISLISDVRRKHRKPSLKMAAAASKETGDPTYINTALQERVA